MTQEEKDLLLKDLCARLPYRLKILYDNTDVREMGLGSLHDFMFDNAEVKPYLRPMSSMTEDEKNYLEEELCTMYNGGVNTDYESFGIEILATHPIYGDSFSQDFTALDWLNAHHFDYRNLIEKGLALEAPEDMYQDIVL